MSDETKSPTGADSNDKDTIDLISDLLDRDFVLTDLLILCHGINAFAVQYKLIPPNDPDASQMSIGFAYVIGKDLPDMKMQSRVDRAARYMSETIINAMRLTWRNIVTSFLMLETDCTRPRSSYKVTYQIATIIRNVKGLHQAEPPTTADDGKKDVVRKTEHEVPNIEDGQKAIKMVTYLYPEEV